MSTFYEGIDLRECAFPLKPSGEVKWAYTSPFGMRYLYGEWGFHNGDDIGSSHYPYFQTPEGWACPAIMSGRATFGYDDTSGYKVNIETAFGTFTYCHLKKHASTTTRDVVAGEVIGYCGTSGGVPAHLHFIWFKNGVAVNPRGLLDAIASARWSDHITPPVTPPVILKELSDMGCVFSVDGGPQVTLEPGGRLRVIRDDGDRSLRLLTLTNVPHPLGGDWVELSSDDPQHAAACKAYYDHYASQLDDDPTND